MGRVFLEHLGGKIALHCSVCNAYLTDMSQCRSTTFHGATGPAYLFEHVVNVTNSSLITRDMTTGKHIVRDVSCKSCSLKLGWLYEFAYETNQVYKEGRVVLEKQLLRKVEESDLNSAASALSRLQCGSTSPSIETESGVSSAEEN